MVPSPLLLKLSEMKPRSWMIMLVSFSCLSFLFVVVCLIFPPLSEDEVQMHHLPQKVKCPDGLSKAEDRSPSGSRSPGMFFVETSERTNLNFRMMCAVESAARTHPNTKVTMLMRGLSNRTSQRLPENLGISFLSCFPNVEFLPLNFKGLFADTPLSSWYLAVEKKRELSDLPNLSDACRLAILWKTGGIYLDTDFIILRNLHNLTNSMGLQSMSTINGAFLSFHAGHHFIKLCMEDFVRMYNYWIYGHQGPQLLTRVFKRWCAIHRLRDSRGCKGVHVLSKEAFYPVDWQAWRRYFEDINPRDLRKLLKDTYGVHLWNKMSQGERVKEGSFLEQLQLHFCPETHKLMKLYL
ncbi:lactosylceramide 4-alpha-galactosyltransferase [Pelodytes ibericus]